MQLLGLVYHLLFDFFNFITCVMVLLREIVAKRVSSEPQMHYKLSPEELSFYRNNGYLVIKGLIGKDVVDSCRDRFIKICNREVPTQVSVVKDDTLYDKNLSGEHYINKIQDILLDEVFMKYSEHPVLLDIVSQLIGEDIVAINCMLINKPPGTARHPPHQDLFYFPVRPADKIIAAWTAVDPVNFENGCLYVVPGSHRAESVYNHALMGKKRKDERGFIFGLEDEDRLAPLDRRVHLEMSPGDTVFFNPYLVHGSGTNTSKFFRKALTCHYANGSCHYIDVTGTNQEEYRRRVKEELRKNNLDFEISDIIRFKIKPVKGVRSNL